MTSQASEHSSVYWPPSSPPKVEPPPPRPLTPSARRLATIEAALAEESAVTLKRPLINSEPIMSNKRQSIHRSGPVHSGVSSLAFNRSNPAYSTVVDLAPLHQVDTSGLNIKQKLMLSSEQLQVLQLVLSGKNVFFTGSAGTGKSVLLREIIIALRKKHKDSPAAVAITASTGIAACNIGGVTLHSFTGVGLGTEDEVELAKKVKKNPKAKERWLQTAVLIIDEVSMVDGILFDKLAYVSRTLRKSALPFGGIQLVVTGDFFQLPPVMKGEQKFAFEAKSWLECVERTVNLTQVFRQKDPEFVNMLNEMRFGKLNLSSVKKFKSLTRPLDESNGIVPTELFPRREDVDRANNARLVSLPGASYTFIATDGGGLVDSEQREKLLSNFMAPKELQLRQNAQVMMIKNVDESLVNGTMGVVVDFMDVLSYSAGTSDDDTAEQHLADIQRSRRKRGPVYPVVRFSLPNGGTRDLLVQKESWKVELPTGETQVSRAQIPLVLSWAMSIHKSQGQTLDKVKVDLGRVFEKGQAYVALSRATSLDGLRILNFDESKVKAHEKVIQWSKSLERFS